VFDFKVEGGPPGASNTIWSRLQSQGLSAGVLTPFSGSVVSEITSRAANSYYDRLGAEPPKRSEITRRYQGHVYLNLSAIAQTDAAYARVRPPSLRFNGELVPLAEVDKGGLLSSFRSGRTQKRIDVLLDEIGRHIDSTSRAASYWLQQVRSRQWTQADVLQVMEEIERTAVDSMMAYLAARYNLDLLYNRLIIDLLPNAGYPASLSLINGALSDIGSLVELGLATSLVELAAQYHSDATTHEATLGWLKQDSFEDWESTAPDPETASGLSAFLATYGHRSVGEAEMARPRWYEDPLPVMRGLLGIIERQAKAPTRTPSAQNVQRLLDSAGESVAKTVPDMIARMRMLHHLQSHSLHALAYVWAGTREWAKAAAHEAAVDGRLQCEEDVFFFELEEIKQMMTGEWNVSDLDGIRSTVEERKREHDTWAGAAVPPLLVDNRPAWSVQPGLPGGSGHVTAPLRRLSDARANNCRGAILGTEHLDSGWALALPVADGFVAATGTPVDACVAAARAWHRPTVVGLGNVYDELVEGAQTILDGDSGLVDQ